MNNFKEKYFDAKTAAALTEEYKNAILNGELNFIYEKIRAEIKKGNNSVTINRFLLKETRSYLTESGYIVKEFNGDQRDPVTETIISWPKNN